MRKIYYGDCHDNFSEEVKKTIQDLKVDFPLYYRHLGKTIRFNFEDYPTKKKWQIATQILSYIFNEKFFFYCCYGDIGIPVKRLKRYIKGIPNKPHCIEYYSPNNNEDFNYEFDNISFVQISPNTFRFDKFAKDISYGQGRGENEQFLISTDEKIAVQFYDCRGMDVVSFNDYSLIESLKTKFEACPYWCEQPIYEQTMTIEECMKYDGPISLPLDVYLANQSFCDFYRNLGCSISIDEETQRVNITF